jgi:hypothetical protein
MPTVRCKGLHSPRLTTLTAYGPLHGGAHSSRTLLATGVHAGRTRLTLAPHVCTSSTAPPGGWQQVLLWQLPGSVLLHLITSTWGHCAGQ